VRKPAYPIPSRTRAATPEAPTKSGELVPVDEERRAGAGVCGEENEHRPHGGDDDEEHGRDHVRDEGPLARRRHLVASVGPLGVPRGKDRTDPDRRAGARDSQYHDEKPDDERNWCRKGQSSRENRGSDNGYRYAGEETGEHVSENERPRCRRRDELHGPHLARLAQRVQSEDCAGDVDTSENQYAPDDERQRAGVADGREECRDEDDHEREQHREADGDPQPADPEPECNRQRT